MKIVSSVSALLAVQSASASICDADFAKGFLHGYLYTHAKKPIKAATRDMPAPTSTLRPSRNIVTGVAADRLSYQAASDMLRSLNQPSTASKSLNSIASGVLTPKTADTLRAPSVWEQTLGYMAYGLGQAADTGNSKRSIKSTAGFVLGEVVGASSDTTHYSPEALAAATGYLCDISNVQDKAHTTGSMNYSPCSEYYFDGKAYHVPLN